jgi:hypothetical protein
MITGLRPARAAYIPALYPAGPDPKIISFFSIVMFLKFLKER